MVSKVAWDGYGGAFMQNANTISAFDVIGPVMIGPSSSHTAGALRLAYLARCLTSGERITYVRFVLYGSFARTRQGHGTDRALIAGILGLDARDIRIRDAFHLAEEAGLSYRFDLDTETPRSHPNTVDMHITTESGRVFQVSGASIGGGQARISFIDGIKVDFRGDYHSIIIRNYDRPGAIAKISDVLSEAGINIALMTVYRERRGAVAFTFIECDEAIPGEIGERLMLLPEVERAIVVAALRP